MSEVTRRIEKLESEVESLETKVNDAILDISVRITRMESRMAILAAVIGAGTAGLQLKGLF
jgi:hypothetical protein